MTDSCPMCGGEQDQLLDIARATLGAGIAAWPWAGQDQCDNLILPLPHGDA